jgi:hypothetical protein
METLLSRASDIIYCKQYIPSSTPVNLVVEYLWKYPRTFLVVADEQKVAGLISREKLLKKICSKKDLELYDQRPISAFMDKNPLILDGNEDLFELCRKVLSRPIQTVYDDVIISNGGVFSGLVSVKQMMLCLLEDVGGQINLLKQRQNMLKKPIVATVMTAETSDADGHHHDLAAAEAFESDDPEPENIAVPLPQEPASHIKLRGHLDAFNVVELVQLLVQGKKTGRLDLLEHNEENPFYTVYIDNGIICHAEGNGGSGKPALWKALKITEGKFIFHYNLQSATITLHDDPIFLLMEACRMQDEAAMVKPLQEAIT